jgi:2-phospho-L-lactate guanylyltransferase (CobY/MobA/RfbA family)
MNDDVGMEIIRLPDGHVVLIPGNLPEETKAEIRRLAAAERDRQESTP